MSPLVKRRVDQAAQIYESALRLGLIILPCDPVHSSAAFRLRAFPGATECQMMEQSSSGILPPTVGAIGLRTTDRDPVKPTVPLAYRPPRVPVPTLRDFIRNEFRGYVETRFAEKQTTRAYYRVNLKHLEDYGPLAGARLDAISADLISGFIAKRREAEYEVSSTNRVLQVLRRMLKLAEEWGRVPRAAKVSLQPGERRRERVLSLEEEARYLKAAATIGDGILEAYERALEGIRATQRGKEPIKPEDPYLLRDASTVLLDCGLRPEELHRLRWDQVRDGALWIPWGKTANARRVIPLESRTAAVLEMRKAVASGPWVFPAATKSGHIGLSTLRKVGDVDFMDA